MNCEEMKNQMLLAQSGELTDTHMNELNDHLETCEECKKYSRLLDMVSANSRPYDFEGPSLETMASVRKAISAENKQNTVIMFPALYRMLAYAALFAMLIGGALLLPKQENRQAKIDNLKDIIAIVSDDDSYTLQSNGANDPENEITRLAEELLRYQEGSDVYFIGEEFLPL